MKISKRSTKTPFENQLSTPEARAERLKRVRNLANLSRKEMCDLNDINVNTYKGWELARFGGLSIEGAEKIVNRVSKAGVICSAEWLLSGKNPAPSLIPEMFDDQSEGNKSNPCCLNQVEREFLIFQNSYKNAILEEVEDDSILPSIKKGDFVAGVKYYGKEIELIIGRLCIIQTLDGKKLVRYLKKGASQGCYSLICANPFSNSPDLVILNIKLLYAAPISRHYITE